MGNLHYNLPRKYCGFGCPFFIIPYVYGTRIEIKYVYSRSVQSLGAESLKLLAPQLLQKFRQFFEN